MVVEVAKALETPRAASTIPMVKIRPGVVEMNHQRGCAGSAGDLDPFGSVDGCASSTVTSYQPSSFRPLNTYALRCTNPDKQILREFHQRHARHGPACANKFQGGQIVRSPSAAAL